MLNKNSNILHLNRLWLESSSPGFVKSSIPRQWRSSHLAVLALRQGRQTARKRRNEASQCTQEAKIKKSNTRK